MHGINFTIMELRNTIYIYYWIAADSELLEVITKDC